MFRSGTRCPSEAKDRMQRGDFTEAFSRPNGALSPCAFPRLTSLETCFGLILTTDNHTRLTYPFYGHVGSRALCIHTTCPQVADWQATQTESVWRSSAKLRRAAIVESDPGRLIPTCALDDTENLVVYADASAADLRDAISSIDGSAVLTNSDFRKRAERPHGP